MVHLFGLLVCNTLPGFGSIITRTGGGTYIQFSTPPSIKAIYIKAIGVELLRVHRSVGTYVGSWYDSNEVSRHQ